MRVLWFLVSHTLQPAPAVAMLVAVHSCEEVSQAGGLQLQIPSVLSGVSVQVPAAMMGVFACLAHRFSLHHRCDRMCSVKAVYCTVTGAHYMSSIFGGLQTQWSSLCLLSAGFSM